MSTELPNVRDIPSRFGRAMLFGAWIVGLALLATLFNNYLEKDRNPNRNLAVQYDASGQPEVILESNRLGHYVASGTINGEPVVFLVDTGATTVSLPLALARQLNLSLTEGGRSRTANGMVHTYNARLDSVSLGGLTIRGMRATVMPNLPGHEILLGMDFLKRFDLLQRDGTLTLRMPQ